MNNADKIHWLPQGKKELPQVWICERSESLWSLLQVRLELEGYRAVRHDTLGSIAEALQFGQAPLLVLYGVDDPLDDWRAEAAAIAAVGTKVQVVAMVNDFERELAAHLRESRLRVLTRPFWFNELRAELQFADFRCSLSVAVQ